MKKIISLLLTFILVFSVNSFAFAVQSDEAKSTTGYTYFDDPRTSLQISTDNFKHIAGIVIKAVTGSVGLGGKYTDKNGDYKYIKPSNSFKYCMNHPAFEGFGRYVLPWEDGAVSKVTAPLSLDFMCSCLGYDSNTVVDGLNFLIDMKNENNLKVMDYYTDSDKQADASKNATKLIFIPGEENAPFAVVVAGGGFNSVCMIQESFPIAMKLHEKGYNVFMLKYRVGEHENDETEFDKRYRAYEDMDNAMKFISANADEFGISMKNYSVWGFSAGARITLTYATDSKYGYLANNLAKPAMIAPIYMEPWDEIQCNNTVPATFMAMGTNDEYYGENGPAACKKLCDNLNSIGVDCIFEEYENMKHGFGLGTGTLAEGWLERAVSLWEGQF